MYGKSNMESYIVICKIESQMGICYMAKKFKQELCINLEGRDKEGNGREVQQGGDICTPIADSC